MITCTQTSHARSHSHRSAWRAPSSLRCSCRLCCRAHAVVCRAHSRHTRAHAHVHVTCFSKKLVGVQLTNHVSHAAETAKLLAVALCTQHAASHDALDKSIGHLRGLTMCCQTCCPHVGPTPHRGHIDMLHCTSTLHCTAHGTGRTSSGGHITCPRGAGVIAAHLHGVWHCSLEHNGDFKNSCENTTCTNLANVILANVVRT